MLSLWTLPARGARSSLCTRCLRLTHPSSRTLSTAILSSTSTQTAQRPSPSTRSQPSPILSCASLSRTYATKSPADEIIEEIQDQYATARDEFEIATEETEKKSVYAADDRAAAREELDKLKELFDKAVEGTVGEEVNRRVGQRVRELDNAVQGLEKAALEE